VRDGRTRCIECTGEVDADHRVPVSRIKLLYRLRRSADAGAIHEHIETTHALRRIADHRRDFVPFTHGAVQSEQPRQLARRALQGGRFDVADINECASR